MSDENFYRDKGKVNRLMQEAHDKRMQAKAEEQERREKEEQEYKWRVPAWVNEEISTCPFCGEPVLANVTEQGDCQIYYEKHIECSNDDCYFWIDAFPTGLSWKKIVEWFNSRWIREEDL